MGSVERAWLRTPVARAVRNTAAVLCTANDRVRCRRPRAAHRWISASTGAACNSSDPQIFGCTTIDIGNGDSQIFEASFARHRGISSQLSRSDIPRVEARPPAAAREEEFPQRPRPSPRARANSARAPAREPGAPRRLPPCGHACWAAQPRNRELRDLLPPLPELRLVHALRRRNAPSSASGTAAASSTSATFSSAVRSCGLVDDAGGTSGLSRRAISGVTVPAAVSHLESVDCATPVSPASSFTDGACGPDSRSTIRFRTPSE
jgi:hypothetical protein